MMPRALAKRSRGLLGLLLLLAGLGALGGALRTWLPPAPLWSRPRRAPA